MRKLAQESPVNLMSTYVTHLRALYMVHQNNHWETQGANFYGNHLLFQRLYEGIAEIIDEAAEKCVGVYGELQSQNVNEIVDKYKVQDKNAESFIQSSLKAEKDFQALAEEVYHALKENSTLTLGVDDMIMSHASISEVHTYLLQQALKS